MKYILLEILDILEYMNNEYNYEDIREKIKKLIIYISNNIGD